MTSRIEIIEMKLLETFRGKSQSFRRLWEVSSEKVGRRTSRRNRELHSWIKWIGRVGVSVHSVSSLSVWFYTTRLFPT